MNRAPWTFVVFRLLGLVGIAVVAGLFFGQTLVWVLGVLVGYLGWNLYHLYRLESWLRTREGELPRDTMGLWGSIFAHLNRMRRRDRSRKKRLAKLVKEFRKSTRALPDGGVVLSADHEIVWLNAAAETFLGLRREDRGRRIQNYLRDPEFVEYMREGRFGRALRMTSPADPDAKLSVQVVPYGKTQLLLLAKDITNEVRLEKVRRSFVANASHELRSPLTVVSGYLDALREDPDLPEGWKEPVGEMDRQAGRMRRIIEDLLTLSRLEAAAPEAERERVDVPGMLAVLKKEALAQDERPSMVELELTSDRGLFGAESEIFSAFANIIGNALKYTPRDGSVSMRWFMDGDAACLSVTDTGVGIPAEAIPRLTERFYRVDKGRDRARGGTGLGLAIVKHVLQRHDATLQIDSEPGRGSTFTCRFPPQRVTPLKPESGAA
jgi:two-component system phosphate regulon sensor histidine kinase PhoR